MSAPDAPENHGEGGGPLRVLANRNFALLFSAGAASTAGFSLGEVALTWLVYVSTGSAAAVAYVAVASTVSSTLLSLIGGTLVDRQDRRALMILSDISRALGLGVLAAYLFLVGFNLFLILCISFVLGAFSTIFNPAQRALMPSVLRPEEVADANGLVQVTASVFQSVASAAGGAVVAFIGAVAAIGLNSATFAISAVLIGSMALGSLGRPRPHGETGAPRRSFATDVADGVRYIASNKGLLNLTLSAGLLNLFFAMMVPFVVVYTSVLLGGGATSYGALLAAFALGLGPGALLVGKTKAVRMAGMVWVGAGLFEGIVLLAIAFTGDFILALALFFVLGVLVGYGNVTWLSAVQLIVPAELQGRYFGVDQLGSFAVVPVGQVLGAFVIQGSGVQVDFLISACGVVATSLAFLLSRDLRHLRYSPPEVTRTAPSS